MFKPNAELLTKLMKKTLITSAVLAATLGAASAQSPSVVVTIENTAPYNGGFLTPVWVGLHNGQFDSYDGGTLASSLPIPGSVAIERLAEDGNTGPISDDFSELVPNGAQATIRSNGPVPPIGPSQIASTLLDVDPAESKYFSYASMIIPSNDAFVANGSPVAHEVFDANGNFVAEPFYIRGSQVDDAGTEFNDELPQNTAFFGQAAPNTGVTTNEVIPGPGHPGLLDPAPGNILGTSRFQDADFLQEDYNLARVKLTFLDKAAPVLFRSELSSQFEIPTPDVDGNPTGNAFFFLDEDEESLIYFAYANGLSGNLTAAHLHLAPKLQTGPVTLPLNVVFGRFAFGRIDADDVVGPLRRGDRDQWVDNVIAEAVSGATYVNFHTARNPGGEIRGQVHLNQF